MLLKVANNGETSTVDGMLSDVDEEGNTALHLAVANGNVDTVALLIDAGSDLSKVVRAVTNIVHC